MTPRESMTDKAYRRLKHDIIQCNLEPGSVIVDAHLAENYGMSTTPIRQAITLLERDGLTVVMPRKGTFVKTIDFSEVRDIYRMRALLEPEAAVLASQRASKDELEELMTLGAQHRDADADGTVTSSDNRNLHVRIAELSRVPILVGTINSLNENIERFLNYRRELGRPYHAVNHGNLVEAICNGDEAEIRAVATAGIERARTHMLQALLGGDQ